MFAASCIAVCPIPPHLVALAVAGIIAAFIGGVVVGVGPRMRA